MIDKLLSIIPFDSVKKWLSENPEYAYFLLLIVIFIVAFVGGTYIA